MGMNSQRFNISYEKLVLTSSTRHTSSYSQPPSAAIHQLSYAYSVSLSFVIPRQARWQEERHVFNLGTGGSG